MMLILQCFSPNMETVLIDRNINVIEYATWLTRIFRVNLNDASVSIPSLYDGWPWFHGMNHMNENYKKIYKLGNVDIWMWRLRSKNLTV